MSQTSELHSFFSLRSTILTTNDKRSEERSNCASFSVTTMSYDPDTSLTRYNFKCLEDKRNCIKYYNEETRISTTAPNTYCPNIQGVVEKSVLIWMKNNDTTINIVVEGCFFYTQKGDKFDIVWYLTSADSIDYDMVASVLNNSKDDTIADLKAIEIKFPNFNKACSNLCKNNGCYPEILVPTDGLEYIVMGIFVGVICVIILVTVVKKFKYR